MDGEKGNTMTSKKESRLVDAMLERFRKALNAEAMDKNAPRRYRKAETAMMGEDVEDID